ncbi:MAG: hypothetical protein KAJ78_03060 [Acidobacteria bacterium]|nr:hypothetical protein [Acidobacteriota bacterium]
MNTSRITAFRKRRLLALLATSAILVLLANPQPVFGQIIFTDINPSWSDLDAGDPNGATGGRVNGLAKVPGSNDSIFYAASEWGGIFKSADGGLNWIRLDRHLPTATWDVEVNPDNVDRVYATSFHDGKTASVSGINLSTNAGATWNHPATATPPGGFCALAAAPAELTAYGISIDPERAWEVYIGTNCGLAISDDSGDTWQFVDTDPGTGAGLVYDVVVHRGGFLYPGFIDVCGNQGHQRSDDGGATWSAPSPDLPGGVCSIAVSPDEFDVLFVTVGANVYESDDGGGSWTNLGTPDSRRQGRIPFVSTNKRSDSGSDQRFDLWFGDVHLYRGECVSNPTGGGQRCPQAVTGPPASPPPAGWFGPFTRSQGGHDDVGDIQFDSEDTVDSCPRLFSSDGGVYWNTKSTSPDCHDPFWEQPNTTPHGLWLWAMAGADAAGQSLEYLYFGVQDNGTFGTATGGAALPSWINRDPNDSFDFAADSGRALYTRCCWGPRANQLRLGAPGLTSGPEVNTYPTSGLLPGFRHPDIIDTFGAGEYVVITSDCTPGQSGCPTANGGDGGIFVTANVSASPIVWTELGDATEPPTAGSTTRACAVKTSVSGGVPTFYVQSGECGLNGHDLLWRFVGTDPTDAWTQVNLPAGDISQFDVDPTNPNRLIAANNRNGDTPAMVMSENGGITWFSLPELDNLMEGDGAFMYRTTLGRFGGDGYAQPSLLAFDADDSDIIAAGGWDSGVFLSTDGGPSWVLVTDPIDAGGPSGSPPHLPRPWYAYFDHESVSAGGINMYIGTRGRGVWRVELGPPPVADADGPYETPEGTDVVLDGTGSSDPTGSIVSYEWDYDDDGLYDDATGATPPFDPVGPHVGQDGVYPVRLKVTNDGGLADSDGSLVTVTNVPPSVVAVSDSPVDENTEVTVSVTLTDPGWLDFLWAEIDWGDGSVGGPMVPTGSENDRPDAVFTFTASHIYGDNGTFAAEVCGHDDDDTTCVVIDLIIDNVDPTAEIDETNIVEGCAEDAFIAHAGDDITFTGRSTDPGSDDLDLTWSWGDGTPDVTTTYLVNPPIPDPYPSPSIQPRDVTDIQVHAFAAACLYQVTFAALDDDLGTSSDTTDVFIAGNAGILRSAGYWYNQFRKIKFFTEDELLCYLAMVNHMSSVFSELTDADSIADAKDTLHPANSNGDIRVQFDRQLLAVWLNFANGAAEFDELMDTDFDSVPDTELLEILCAAEAARLNPGTPDNVLENWKDILEGINLLDETAANS